MVDADDGMDRERESDEQERTGPAAVESEGDGQEAQGRGEGTRCDVGVHEHEGGSGNGQGATGCSEEGGVDPGAAAGKEAAREAVGSHEEKPDRKNVSGEEDPDEGKMREPKKSGEKPREDGSMGEGGNEDGIARIKIWIKDVTNAGRVEPCISGEGMVAVDDEDEGRENKRQEAIEERIRDGGSFSVGRNWTRVGGDGHQRCVCTSSIAWLETAGSLPKPGSQWTSGSRRNHVSWRLA